MVFAGARWSSTDRFTATTPITSVAANLDAGKMLLRIDQDRGIVPTLAACVAAAGALNDRRMMAMVELILYTTDATGVPSGTTDPDALIKAVGVCAGLGRVIRLHVAEDPSDCVTLPPPPRRRLSRY